MLKGSMWHFFMLEDIKNTLNIYPLALSLMGQIIFFILKFFKRTKYPKVRKSKIF